MTELSTPQPGGLLDWQVETLRQIARIPNTALAEHNRRIDEAYRAMFHPLPPVVIEPLDWDESPVRSLAVRATPFQFLNPEVFVGGESIGRLTGDLTVEDRNMVPIDFTWRDMVRDTPDPPSITITVKFDGRADPPLPFDRPKRPKKPTRVKLELGEEYSVLAFSYRLTQIPNTPFDVVGNYVVFTLEQSGFASDRPINFLQEYEIEHNGHTCILECRDRRSEWPNLRAMFRVKEVLPSQKYLWEEFAC